MTSNFFDTTELTDALMWCDLFDSSVSTNDRIAHRHFSDTLLTVGQRDGMVSTSINPFSLVLGAIDLPALEKIAIKDAAKFSESVDSYRQFRLRVVEFFAQLGSLPIENSQSEVVRFARECARDIFLRPIHKPRSHRSNAVRAVKDSLATMMISFLGVQSVHGWRGGELNEMRLRALEAFIPALALLAKQMGGEYINERSAARAFLQHCSLFVEADYEALTVDVVESLGSH